MTDATPGTTPDVSTPFDTTTNGAPEPELSRATATAATLLLATNIPMALLSALGTAFAAWLYVSGGSSDEDGHSTAPALGFAIAGLVILALSVWGIALARGVRRRRSLARRAAIVLCSIYAGVSAVFLLAAFLDPFVDAATGVIAGAIPLVVNVAIAALLLTSAAREDVRTAPDG